MGSRPQRIARAGASHQTGRILPMKSKRKLALTALVAALLVVVHQVALGFMSSGDTVAQNNLAVATVNGGDAAFVAQHSYANGVSTASLLLAFALFLVFLAALKLIYRRNDGVNFL